VTSLSTGVRTLDRLIDNLRFGDNLVWEVSGVDETPFVAAFVKAARGARLAYVSFHVSPQAILDRFSDDWDHEQFVLLDCFTDGIARGDRTAGAFYRRAAARRPGVERIDSSSGPGGLLEALADLEQRLGRGARYVFDSLTGIQDLWGQEAAVMLFLRSCPRLYDLRTAAYWLVEQTAHDASFLSRLRHVTQVVLQLHDGESGPSIRVAKALGRAPEVAGRGARVSFERAKPVLQQEPASEDRPIGEELKRHRIARGFGQAELARRIGISPSALSQVERGRSGLAPTTLERAREVLGLAHDGDAVMRTAYRLSRRGAREEITVAPGMAAEELARATGHVVFLVRVAPQGSGRRTPVATKREEFIMVVGGILELRIGESREVLHAGDSILLERELVSSWRNPGPQETELLWSVLGGG
jgi:transcriptional regulator with XRE-family HTH domain